MPTSASPAATAMAAPLPVPLARLSGSPGYAAAPSLPRSLQPQQHSGLLASRGTALPRAHHPSCICAMCTRLGNSQESVA